MKIDILHSNKSEPDEGCTFDIESSTAFSKNKVRLLSLIIGMFLFCLPFATFAQTPQADLRLLTDAYEPGKCPAQDVRVVSATLVTENPCFTCTGGQVTLPLRIRVNHNTESHDRFLAICGTLVETLPGGGTVETDISRCFGPLLTSSEQVGGGQDLATFNVTFTCGSTLQLTDILLVWTAANGECPVTLANNPNGKYCWNNPVVDIPTAIMLTESHVNAGCFGSATGSINLSVSGGVPPYTYAWTASAGGVIPSGQADDQDLSLLVAGTYSVTVTDSKGCTATKSVSITQNPRAIPTITKDPASVDTTCGVSAEAAQTAVNTAFNNWLAVAPVTGGGTPTLVVTRSPLNPTAPSYTGGNTSVTWTVTDACGETATVTAAFTVTNPCTVACGATPAPVLCFGASTGSITVNASGGVTPYTFHLYLSSNLVTPVVPPVTVNSDLVDPVQNVFSNLAAGAYTIFVTDAVTTLAQATPCTATIIQPAAALTSTISDVDVLCFGGATGSINLTPSGGTPPYAYAWTASNGGVIPAGQADDQDLSGLVAGTYSVVITDANGTTGGCRATNSAVISQPAAALTSTISDVDVLCFGAATGSINLTPSGGTPPYTYAWTATLGGVIPAGQEDDQDLSGLVAGTYSVVITDANGTTGGCRATNSAVISQPTSGLTSTISDVDVLCFGGATGSINLTPSGGTPPYAYAWTASNGGVIPAGQADDQDLSGLVAGTYSVVITDASGTTGGCLSQNSAVISQPAAALTSTISDVDVLCFGAATGSINLTPSGGTPPYAYAWTASNGGVIPAGQEDDQDLSGLVAGTYSVVITDANGTTGGCRATNSAVISQPAAALTSTISDVDVLCFGAATGSINLTPSGGTPPYTYAWTATLGGVIPAGQADDQDLSGLVAGTYSVVITDANGTTGGCRATNSAVISQPTTGLTSTISDVDVLCFGGATGSINLTPSGGTPPYTFAWTASNGGVIPAGQADDEDLSGLVAGTYSVVITDASGTSGGCLSQNSAVISQPAAALSSTISDVDVLCFGAATGSINLTPTGGTPPYAYAWTASNGGVIPAGQADDQDLSGLVAGTYSVVITDANGTTGGCRATNSAVISQPAAALTSTISDVDVLCNGRATGSINLTPSGGTPPYAYAWTASNGGVIPAGQADDQDLSGLVAGTYSVVITDANGTTGGCRATNEAVISQPALLSCTITKVRDVQCAGGLNGSATVNVTGGTGAYTYAWDDNETTPTATGLGGGLHTITVTDANGCTTSCTITLDVIPCGGHIFPTQTACCNIVAGNATELENVCYTTRTGIVSNAIPGVFFYYTKLTAPSSSFTINVVQTKSCPSFNLFAVHGNKDIKLFGPNCTRVNSVVISVPTNGQAQMVVSGATAGVEYVLGVKYDVKSLIGSTYVGSAPTCTYDFVTKLSYGAVVNQTVAGSAGSIDAVNGCSDNTPLPPACTDGLQVADNSPAPSGQTVETMFSAYPVPFKEYINVRYEFNYHSKARIEIYDAKGMFIKAYDDADAYFNKEVRLDVNFNQGDGQMYIIKVITDNEVGTKRIISKE